MSTSLFVLGDSISIHYGPWLRRYLGHAFEYNRKGGPEVGEDHGPAPDPANGRDSVHVLSYLEDLQSSGFSTDILLVNCGLHDIRHEPSMRQCQTNLPDYHSNLSQIVAIGRQISRQTVWVRTTPIRADTETRFMRDVDIYNAAADEIMGEHSIPIIDLHGLTLSLGMEAFNDDHVHFVLDFRRLQGAFIAGWLQQFALSRKVGAVSPVRKEQLITVGSL